MLADGTSCFAIRLRSPWRLGVTVYCSALTTSVQPAQVRLAHRAGIFVDHSAAALCQLTHGQSITRNASAPTAFGRVDTLSSA
jgi:hypothetical protein